MLQTKARVLNWKCDCVFFIEDIDDEVYVVKFFCMKTFSLPVVYCVYRRLTVKQTDRQKFFFSW